MLTTPSLAGVGAQFTGMSQAYILGRSARAHCRDHFCRGGGRARAGALTARRAQIAGGHKYLPPRQDVSAPDLYIPLMAACTYCVLASMAQTAGKRFKPDTMYATVRSPARYLGYVCCSVQGPLVLKHCTSVVHALENSNPEWPLLSRRHAA